MLMDKVMENDKKLDANNQLAMEGQDDDFALEDLTP